MSCSLPQESFYAKLKKFADENNTNLYVSNIPKNMNEHVCHACMSVCLISQLLTGARNLELFLHPIRFALAESSAIVAAMDVVLALLGKHLRSLKSRKPLTVCSDLRLARSAKRLSEALITLLSLSLVAKNISSRFATPIPTNRSFSSNRLPPVVSSALRSTT